MKTAILLVGNVRTWSYCKDNFIQTFGHLNPDIFVSTYNLQYNHHPYIQNLINDNEDVLLTNDEIVNIFSGVNVKNINIDSNLNYALPENVNGLFSGLETTFHQYIKFFESVQKMTEYGDYDLVIKTRCDLLYNPINFDNALNSIIIDSGNVYPNDCILISNKDNIVDISKFIVNEFFNPVYNNSHDTPPHGLLRNAINHLNIPVQQQKIMHCVVRKGNKLQQY
jgi:hypothetical protein